MISKYFNRIQFNLKIYWKRLQNSRAYATIKIMKNPFDVLEQNSLNFKLTPIAFREIFFIPLAPCDVYALVDGLFKIIIPAKTELTNNFLNSPATYW